MHSSIQSLSFASALVLSIAAPATARGGPGDSGIPFILPSAEFEFSAGTGQSAGRTAVVGGDWAALRGPDESLLTIFHRDAAGAWSIHSTVAAPGSGGTTTNKPAAISGELLLFGAPSGNGLGGEVKVYTLELGGLIPAVGVPRPTGAATQFGARLAFDGATLVVGSGNQGSAPWIFERTEAGTWILRGQLPLPPDPVSTNFAVSMVIEGDVLVLGDPLAKSLTQPTITVGGLTIYERSRSGIWSPTAAIRAPDDHPGTEFGRSIALSEGRIAVGAALWPAPEAPFGAAFIVERDDRGEWTIGPRIDAEPPLFNSDFGQQVHLHGARLAVFSTPPQYEWPVSHHLALFVRNDEGAWVRGSRLAVPWLLYAYSGSSSRSASDGETLLIARSRHAFGLPYDPQTPAVELFDFAFDCDQNGVEDVLEIDAGLVADCNGNRRPDPCDIAAGRIDGNGDELLDYCQSDCNGNGIPDGDDLASGATPDCNANGIPDACEIAFGLATDFDSDEVPDDCQVDCDSNGVPDAFDIANGGAVDCDRNGIPDACGAYDELPVQYQTGQATFTGNQKGVLLARRFTVKEGESSIGQIDLALITPIFSFPCPTNGLVVTIGLFADDQIPGPAGSTLLWSSTFVPNDVPTTATYYETKFPSIVPGAPGEDFYVAALFMLTEPCEANQIAPIVVDNCEDATEPGCSGDVFFRFATTLTPDFVALTAQSTEFSVPAPFIPILYPVSTPCAGVADTDGDGHVNGADLARILGSWGPCPQCGQCEADLNTDCTVDGGDLAFVLGNWTG